MYAPRGPYPPPASPYQQHDGPPFVPMARPPPLAPTFSVGQPAPLSHTSSYAPLSVPSNASSAVPMMHYCPPPPAHHQRVDAGRFMSADVRPPMAPMHLYGGPTSPYASHRPLPPPAAPSAAAAGAGAGGDPLSATPTMNHFTSVGHRHGAGGVGAGRPNGWLYQYPYPHHGGSPRVALPKAEAGAVALPGGGSSGGINGRVSAGQFMSHTGAGATKAAAMAPGYTRLSEAGSPGSESNKSFSVNRMRTGSSRTRPPLHPLTHTAKSPSGSQSVDIALPPPIPRPMRSTRPPLPVHVPLPHAPTRKGEFEQMSRREMQERNVSIIQLRDQLHDIESEQSWDRVRHGRELSDLQTQLRHRDDQLQKIKREVAQLKEEEHAAQIELAQLEQKRLAILNTKTAAAAAASAAADTFTTESTDLPTPSDVTKALQKTATELIQLDERVGEQAQRISELEQQQRMADQLGGQLRDGISARAAQMDGEVGSLASSLAQRVEDIHRLKCQLAAKKATSAASSPPERDDENHELQEGERRVTERRVEVDRLRQRVATYAKQKEDLERALGTKDQLLVTVQLQLDQAKRTVEEQEAEIKVLRSEKQPELISVLNRYPTSAERQVWTGAKERERETLSLPPPSPTHRALDRPPPIATGSSTSSSERVDALLEKFSSARLLKVSFLREPGKDGRYRYGSQVVTLAAREKPSVLALSPPSSPSEIGKTIMVHYGKNSVLPMEEFVSRFEAEELSGAALRPPTATPAVTTEPQPDDKDAFESGPADPRWTDPPLTAAAGDDAQHQLSQGGGGGVEGWVSFARESEGVWPSHPPPDGTTHVSFDGPVAQEQPMDDAFREMDAAQWG
ncbi:unnamed protein product [Vitrella brassicaformis CCMP3155]|uniref:Uncharacterized protein n=3 Tax=Vitrella brassicaformis TaxID=1169539 RepID=A0A0G4E8Z4_VITBC|nr:unnamed protein product [Vitrella brassicaformis CCMP3155]|eukprot:CEL91865.1 unnamed protein product [Vitrella brassicaformis CCMP3155]